MTLSATSFVLRSQEAIRISVPRKSELLVLEKLDMAIRSGKSMAAGVKVTFTRPDDEQDSAVDDVSALVVNSALCCVSFILSDQH